MTQTNPIIGCEVVIVYFSSFFLPYHHSTCLEMEAPKRRVTSKHNADYYYEEDFDLVRRFEELKNVITH